MNGYLNKVIKPIHSLWYVIFNNEYSFWYYFLEQGSVWVHKDKIDIVKLVKG